MTTIIRLTQKLTSSHQPTALSDQLNSLEA